MSDILERAKWLAERYNDSGHIHRDATLLLPDLITECEKWRQKAILERAMCYIGGPAYWSLLSNEYAKELLDRAEKELME